MAQSRVRLIHRFLSEIVERHDEVGEIRRACVTGDHHQMTMIITDRSAYRSSTTVFCQTESIQLLSYNCQFSSEVNSF